MKLKLKLKMKKKSFLIMVGIVFLVLIVNIASAGIWDDILNLFSTSDPMPFSITEINTNYGIAENIIILEITDLIDKDQYILNISEIFADHFLTDQIEIKEVLLNQSYEADVKGYLNESQGKYKTVETVEEPYNCTSNNETNEATCLYHNVDYYYDDTNNLMDCDYVLADKTCLKTVYGVVGTEIKSDFLNLPTNKEKIKIAGLKIEQKQDGLSIPLPKGSTVQLKIRYSHPLAYNLKVPENVNKYDIQMVTADGSVTLDPTWWNNSYDRKRNITSVPDVDLTLNVNGTSGFYGNRIFVNPANCNGDLTVYYKSTNTSDYVVVCNDTTEITWTANNLISYWKHDDATTSGSVSIDSINANNGTITGATTGITGQIAEAYSFDGNDYITIPYSDFVTNAGTFSIWFKRSGLPSVLDMLYTIAQSTSSNTWWVALTSSGYIKFDNGVAQDHRWEYQTNVCNNVWHHLVYLSDGSAEKVYMDGSDVTSSLVWLLGSNDGQWTDDTGTVNNFLFGGLLYDNNGAPAYNYTGTLDEIGYWSRALSSTEVEFLYNNTKDSFNNMLLGAEESAPLTYNLNGTVKDSNNVVVNNATIIIINQADNTIVSVTSSNSTGGWTYNIGSTGTYLVVAYDPNNSTRDGDADPFIIVS